MTRDELIAALEKAEGPDRALDSAIYAELRLDGWTPEEWAVTLADPKFINPTIPGVAAYTASIDAALTLVPDGYVWRMHQPAVGLKGKWVAEIFTQPMWDSCREGKHPTAPAIAIVIAALRARAAA